MVSNRAYSSVLVPGDDHGRAYCESVGRFEKVIKQRLGQDKAPHEQIKQELERSQITFIKALCGLHICSRRFGQPGKTGN